MALSDIERITAFEHRFARAQATEVVDLRWGFALLQSDFQHSRNHNKIVVTSSASSVDILSRADELLGGAGLKHRYVSVDDDSLGQALRPDFVAAGYDHETIVTMIYFGSEPEPSSHEVRVVSLDVLRPAIIRDWRVELPLATAEELDQLAGRTALYPRGAELTLLAVFDGDDIAARADLYVDRVGRIAQFESLVTHSDFRRRGYASSLIRNALTRAREAGSELSFLTADLNDWPHEWYQRLGYIDAGKTHHFTRSG